MMKSLTDHVWTTLSSVNSLTFVSRSESAETTGWNAKATGTVRVISESSGSMLFVENGWWSTPDDRRVEFSNTYRWCRSDDMIQLEHLRFGADRPVYLFDLVPYGPDLLVSHQPHRCADDLYSAELESQAEGIRLTWTVVGPTLDETIEYCYGQGLGGDPDASHHVRPAKAKGQTEHATTRETTA